MRILDKSSVFVGLDKLGFSDEHLARIRTMLRQPSGLIATTGPTGCGKTTTMYSMLLEVRSPALKIMTIEDPVECLLDGVNHGHVNVKAGFTFPVALRSFMRHDPDVMMVGELRDFETISLAVQAAVTGHLVLSQLHASDALKAISRFVEVGVEPYLVGSCLVGIVSQRLVRLVCRKCREDLPADAADPLMGYFGISADELAAAAMARGKGCETCRGTGYRGRLGLYEVLTMDRDLASMVGNGAAPSELLEAARAKGFKTMREDAKAKVLAGLTTPEEAMRVLV